MRERVRVFIAACFYYSALVKLAHWWIRRSEPRLIILNYHRATAQNLGRQMRYLRRHYRILHLEEALQDFFLPDKDTLKMRSHDRRMPLVLTFDDGYRDNYTHAFALAQKLQIPITIFLIPGYIESGACFWWLEGKRLVEEAQVDKATIDGHTYSLKEIVERKTLAKVIDAKARHAGTIAEREAFLADMRQMLGVPSPVAQDEAVRPLTWAEVREMDESGWVSFGAHTMHHPILAYLTDPEEVQREVIECRSILEQQLSHPVRTFAYPIGKLEHIGEQGLQAVKAAEYEWALTTIEDVNTLQSHPHLLNRLPGDVNQHWLVMASELVGLLGIFSRLWKHNKRLPKRFSWLERMVRA
jgi:peptidoglycan/xylan/chitin deacetylase (PgdA/CDA1 family)